MGDCLIAMKGIPDKSIDLILTDPPYGVNIVKKGLISGYINLNGTSKQKGFKTQKYYTPKEWDSKVPTKDYFDEMIRISKNQIIFGGNYFSSMLPNSSCWIVWDKKEKVTNDFADCELAWTSFKKGVRKFQYGWTGFEGINNTKRDNDKKLHPTQKPRKLFEWIIEKYSKEGMTILDPFAGSGTTGVACKNLNRNYILIEKEQEYIDIINKRLNEKENNHTA